MADKRSRALRITDLPETALFRVFDLAGKEHGQSICLVCKSWNELYFQSPGLWRSLVLDSRPAALRPKRKLAAWLAAKRALLQKLGSLVTDVDAELTDPWEAYDGCEEAPEEDGEEMDEEEEEAAWDEAGGGQLGDSLWEGIRTLLLALPPSLKDLRLMLQCSQVRAAGLVLPSLPALARLQLEVPYEPGSTAVQPLAAAWLARLPQLRAFSWSSVGTDLSPQLVGAVASLSGLTALELQVASEFGVRGRLPPEASAAIAGLTALQDLCCDGSELPAELVRAAARLQHLTALSLSGLPDDAPLAQLAALGRLHRLLLTTAAPVCSTVELPAPAGFPELAYFRAEGRGRRVQFQVAGIRLSNCLWDGKVAGWLSIQGLRGMRSWTQLLSALRPPAGTAPLRTLHLKDCELPTDAMQGCPPLPALIQLRLSHCTADATVATTHGPPGAPLAGSAAAALLRAAPRVQMLGMDSCFQEQLPTELAAMRGITKLDLSANDLTDVPPGAWLAALKTISLAGNAFTTLPPALSGATGLTELGLSSNWQLKLDGAAADLLAPLKQLPRVSFPGGPYFESFSKRLAELLPPGRVGYDRAMRTSGRSTRDKALRQGRRR